MATRPKAKAKRKSTRGKALAKPTLPVDSRGGWYPLIRESYAGAWQQNVTVTLEDALQYWAVFRCISIIAGDIAKIPMCFKTKLENGIWIDVPDEKKYLSVIRKPNPYQNRIQFFENWMGSKLSRGNAYVLKARDVLGYVVALYILDPNRVTPLVTETGEVFYRLNRDNMSGLIDDVVVPASEIIHDRFNCLYHPLVGLSPLYASGINAMMGLSLEKNSARFFANGARPSGVLETPGQIKQSQADQLKADWDEKFAGANAGKVAVLSDGMKYSPMSMSMVDSQTVEQAKWIDASIAAAFGVPGYMIGAGQFPMQTNIQAVQQLYFEQALQTHIESIELCLDEGLEVEMIKGRPTGFEFSVDEGLLRMDTATQMRTVTEGLKGVYTPNEGRAKFNLGPQEGGNTVYLQQQNFSLAALAKRDASDDPFGTAKPDPAPAEPAAANDNPEDAPADVDAAAKSVDLLEYDEIVRKVFEAAT